MPSANNFCITCGILQCGCAATRTVPHMMEKQNIFRALGGRRQLLLVPVVISDGSTSSYQRTRLPLPSGTSLPLMDTPVSQHHAPPVIQRKGREGSMSGCGIESVAVRGDAPSIAAHLGTGGPRHTTERQQQKPSGPKRQESILARKNRVQNTTLLLELTHKSKIHHLSGRVSAVAISLRLKNLLPFREKSSWCRSSQYRGIYTTTAALRAISHPTRNP